MNTCEFQNARVQTSKTATLSTLLVEIKPIIGSWWILDLAVLVQERRSWMHLLNVASLADYDVNSPNRTGSGKGPLVLRLEPQIASLFSSEYSQYSIKFLSLMGRRAFEVGDITEQRTQLHPARVGLGASSFTKQYVEEGWKVFHSLRSTYRVYTKSKAMVVWKHCLCLLLHALTLIS
jgi:hypothetical protein